MDKRRRLLKKRVKRLWPQCATHPCDFMWNSIHRSTMTKWLQGTLWTCCYMNLHKVNKVHQSLYIFLNYKSCRIHPVTSQPFTDCPRKCFGMLGHDHGARHWHTSHPESREESKSKDKASYLHLLVRRSETSRLSQAQGQPCQLLPASGSWPKW